MQSGESDRDYLILGEGSADSVTSVNGADRDRTGDPLLAKPFKAVGYASNL